MIQKPLKKEIHQRFTIKSLEIKLFHICFVLVQAQVWKLKRENAEHRKKQTGYVGPNLSG